MKKSKSECACKAAKKMNKDLEVIPQKLLVCPKTEDIYDEKFWTEIDFVVNAVDNINARVFIDSKCVLYLKPLFESGTLGTKCNS